MDDNRHRDDLSRTAHDRQIDQLCDRFEARWKAGERPQIEDFLTLVQPARHSALFADLLALELSYREERGERLVADEYCGRYPERTDAILSAFEGLAKRSLPATLDYSSPGGAPLGSTVPAGAQPQSWDCPAGGGPRLGEFSLLRSLGEGAMGTVWEAEQAGTGRRVAVKVMSKRLPRTPQTVARFLREARLAAAVSHPRSTFVLGAGEEAGQPYIAMELMPGRTLADVIRNGGAQRVNRAVDYILDVIDGLQAAHAQDVVHRDVKPSNCFLDGDGRVKVGDYGISKSLVADAALTATGAFVGTPQYAAPEQVRGGEVDHRTDIYAVGATLFHLLTGRPPFVGDATAVVAQIASDPPPPIRSLRHDVPETLDRIVCRALEKRPDRRFQDLTQLRFALQPFATGGTSIADVGRRLPAYMIDIALVTILGLAFYAPIAELLIGAAAFTISPQKSSGNVSYVRIVQDGFSLAWMVAVVLYFALSEARWGCTLGKYLLGLRVIGVEGAPIDLRRAIVRAFGLPGGFGLWIIASYLQHAVQGLAATFPTSSGGLLVFAVLPLGYSCEFICLTTMRGRNGYRGLHELVSRTRVVRLTRSAESNRAGPGVVVVAAAGRDSMLGPFHVLGDLGRIRDERVVLAEDRVLSRRVWIHLGAESVMPQRKALRRASRPHWLQNGETANGHWEAFDAVVGAPLSSLEPAHGETNWDRSRFWLFDLAEELAAASADGTLPATLRLQQIWIDGSGRTKLLDQPLFLLRTNCDSAPARHGTEIEQAVGLLREATEICTRDQPIPTHVLDFVAELARRPDNFTTLAWAADQLREDLGHKTALAWDDRLGVLAVSLGTEFPVLLGVLVFHCLVVRLPHLWPLTATMCAMLILPAILGFMFQGGPAFRLTRVEVRRTNGRKAGKRRCAWRNSVAWGSFLLPFVLVVGLPVHLMRLDLLPSWYHVVFPLSAIFLLSFPIGVIYSVARPRRGLPDRLAGTCLVPR
jgi:uncharacterized RDD family membrane protein YckC